jgi:hypothetical protein
LQFPQQEVEARSIKNLLELSKYGIHFHDEVHKTMLPKLKLMLKSEGYKRYLLLLEILFELSKCENYELLNKKSCLTPLSQKQNPTGKYFHLC